MEHYLVYTNITGSSDVPKIESFLNRSGYSFDYEPVYHKHCIKNHTGYIKCFALVDTSLECVSQELISDVLKRCEVLHEKSVRIVLCNLWESPNQIMTTKWADLLQKFDPLIWHGGTSFFWHLMYDRYKDQKFKFYHVEKKYDFLYLNKTSRTHREMMWQKLQHGKLLDHSLVSFHHKKIYLPASYELPWLNGEPYPAYGRDRDIFEKPYNETVFNIVSETSDSEKFFTEKIWKPIMAKQPFVVHGKPGYLHDLRSLGFQTFGDHIDESYDEIESGTLRIDAIASACRHIKDHIRRNHLNFYFATKPIREHNHDIFFSESHLRSAVKDTVSELLELIDGSKVPPRETQTIN